MLIGWKDGLKLFGISIVCVCAVFVCTFMLSFYIDVQSFRDAVLDSQTLALYNAQVATAQVCSVVTGGVLSVIAVIMLIFYIKLFIDGHSKQLGIIKAFGYSDFKIALKFWVFGLSVFFGCVIGYICGYAVAPIIYDGMSIEGLPEITLNFHIMLPFTLINLPTILLSVIACVYAFFALRQPVMLLLKGKSQKILKKQYKNGKEKPFLTEMFFKVLSSKKSLVFFVTFSAFCFGTMMQMGLTMDELSSQTMGYIILIIGLILAIVTMFMAITTLINENKKNISIMKAFGYSLKECSLCVLGGFIPFAILGFGLGTAYQYGLLQLMVNVVFADVGTIPEYTFNVPIFFISFALFLVCYICTIIFYIFRINKISVKEIMLEN